MLASQRCFIFCHFRKWCSCPVSNSQLYNSIDRFSWDACPKPFFIEVMATALYLVLFVTTLSTLNPTRHIGNKGEPLARWYRNLWPVGISMWLVSHRTIVCLSHSLKADALQVLASLPSLTQQGEFSVYFHLHALFSARLIAAQGW